MRPRAHLVLNPAAGRGRAFDLATARTLLSARFELTVVETSRRDGPAAAARRALAAGAEALIAAGGDGTVSAVASALIGTAVPLGILPCGTSSSIASALGVPAALEDACGVILGGRTRRIDTARCDGRTMVLLCAVGLHAEAVAETPGARKRRWGALAYLLTAARKIARLNSFAIELRCDGALARGHASSVTVANLAPARTVLAHGPAEVRPDDGRLDVTVVSARSPAEILRAALRLFRAARRGEAGSSEGIGSMSGRCIRLSTRPRRRVLVDGEVFGTTPVTIECAPASLLVFAPPPPPASG